MTKKQVQKQVSEILSTLSSYTEYRIIELMEYSIETELQLISLMSASYKNVLANKIKKRFTKINQQGLYDQLFVKIKTAEKLIDYVYEKYRTASFPAA